MQAPGANQNCARSLGGKGGSDTSGKIGKSFVWVVRVWDERVPTHHTGMLNTIAHRRPQAHVHSLFATHRVEEANPVGTRANVLLRQFLGFRTVLAAGAPQADKSFFLFCLIWVCGVDRKLWNQL